MGPFHSISARPSRPRRDASSGRADAEGPNAGGATCLAVMYHYVHDRPPVVGAALGLSGVRGLSSAEFEAQLDLLSRSMEPIDWPTLYAWTQGRGSMPDRCFLLTFDDGLADHAQVVAPILERRGLRGVFFVPGVVLTSQRLLSAHAIHLLLARIDEQTLEEELLAYLAIHGDGRDWATLIEPDAARTLYPYESAERGRLKYLLTVVLPIELREAALAAMFERHIGSMTRWARRWYLGWDELVAMEASGHTIGAHGHAHEPYTRFSPEEARNDLARVASVLRNGLGPDLRPFSYPYGRFNDGVSAACRAAGFAHAFTTEERSITAGADAFRLPRVDTIHVNEFLRSHAACPSS